MKMSINLCFSKHLPVYNSAAGNRFKVTIKQLLDMGIHGVCEEFPMERMILLPFGGVTVCKPLNFVRLMIYQILPAILIDFGMKFGKQKPR